MGRPSTVTQGYYNKLYNDAVEQLLRLNIDPDFMIDFKERSHGLHGTEPTAAEKDQYQAMVDDGSRQFVQLAVAMPQKLNRPKFYSDPRYKLFTTLQGYISTFTSTILPVIYSNLSLIHI